MVETICTAYRANVAQQDVDRKGSQSEVRVFTCNKQVGGAHSIVYEGGYP